MNNKKQKILWLIILSIIFILTSCNESKETLTEANEQIEKESQSIENNNEEIELEEKEEISEIPEPQEPQEIVIAFMGDVMMDSYIGDYIRERGVDYPWEDVADITREADLAVINLETSVSTRGSTKKPEGYGFRSNPDSLQGLVNSGIDLVSLANNHTLDFGEDAFMIL